MFLTSNIKHRRCLGQNKHSFIQHEIKTNSIFLIYVPGFIENDSLMHLNLIYFKTFWKYGLFWENVISKCPCPNKCQRFNPFFLFIKERSIVSFYKHSENVTWTF